MVVYRSIPSSQSEEEGATAEGHHPPRKEEKQVQGHRRERKAGGREGLPPQKDARIIINLEKKKMKKMTLGRTPEGRFAAFLAFSFLRAVVIYEY